MTTAILAENIKKYRLAKGLTQEQTAELLQVNPQTVSRWECGTTLPDALTLPRLAKLFGVTVDDFYRKLSVVYENYAQRLSAVYEKTRDPEDFIRCMLEYKKLMKHTELSTADKWNYATIHHFMLQHCKASALKWYERAIADGPEADPDAYRRARSLRTKLLFEIGRGDEAINRQKELTALHPNDPQEWGFLIEAYIWAGRYEDAYASYREAIRRFPENWLLYLYGGDACKGLQRYEEAFACWDKAGELGTAFHDELYCKAGCYELLGEYEKARAIYLELAELLREEHFDVEAEMAEEAAAHLRHS